MDDCHFDRIVRLLAGEGETRRGVLRLLTGGALGLLTARLGLAEDARAKKPKRKPRRRPARMRSKTKPQGSLQAEGKRRGKKGKKKPKDPPPLPPECRDCTECQMCQDGGCVPDTALDGVRCLGSGATCGYCQNGQCAASDRLPCPDGVCPPRGKCCPGQRQCVDPESTSGWSCIDPETMCCPDEKRCRDDCIPRDTCCDENRPQCGPCEELFCNRHGVWICLKQCCSGQKDCGGGVCVADDECCPDETPCDDGSCAAPGQCCPDLYQCEDGTCVDPFDECCPGQRYCGGGVCIAEGECCPGETRCNGACHSNPPCSFPCGEVVCEEGELICRPRQVDEGKICGGLGTICCKGVCYDARCRPASNGTPRHFNPNTCRCECDRVQQCPPGQGWSHATCSCVCNCLGRCCLSGCCTHPDGGGAHCCQGF
jgi:hypothetical protein